MKNNQTAEFPVLPHGIYDSHVHLTDDAFEENLEEVIARAKENGIIGVIVPGDSIASSRAAIRLAEQYPDYIRAAVGIHPYDTRYYCDQIEKELIALSQNPYCVAIGEIGLDFRKDESDPSPPEVQREAFQSQMILTKKLGLPVIIHCRNAYSELISVVSGDEYKEIRGVVHCFSGTRDEALKLVESGWHIGFTGTLTFKNAPKIREAASAIPLERILVETDAPYLTPHPFRGRFPNEPVYVSYVALELAKCRQTSMEEVCRKTKENTKRLFNIK